MWFLFPFCVIPSSRRDKRTRRPGGLTQVQLIKQRLTRWRSGEVSELWHEALTLTKTSRRKKKKKLSASEQKEWNIKQASQRASEGQFGKAMQALTSAGLAPTTLENLAKMKALHPEARPPVERNTEEQQIRVSCDEVKKAVFMMRSGSSPGPDGHKPSHYKAALSESAPGRRDRALASLTRLINSIADGNVPDSIKPFFSSATLHGVPKKDGSLRPIACGILLRRITAKTIAKKLMPRAAALFSPLQLGVGIPNACESIIHSAKIILDSDPSLWVLQSDLVSAYNQCDRDYILEETKNQFPEILKFVQTCYGQHRPLFFGEHIVMSQKGTAQGDPLAGLLFSLVLFPVNKEIHERVPRLRLHVWLCDDGTMIGKKEDLRQVVEVINEMGPERGLTLSTDRSVPGHGKTVVWSPAFPPDIGPDPLECGTRKVEDAGIKLLGAPVGSEDFTRQQLEEAIDKIRRITAALPSLEDSMSQFCLLRSTLGLSKFGYLIRTVNTSAHIAQLMEFDHIQRQALNDLMGSTLSHTAVNQAVLPVSCGGLGLRRSYDHGPAAYVASVVASLGLIHRLVGERDMLVENSEAEDGVDTEEQFVSPLLTPSVMARLSESVGEEVLLTEVLAGTSQKVLSRRTDEFQQQKLVESFTDSVRDRARLLALSRPKAREFLNSIPNRRTGTYLRNEQWVAVVRYSLGEPVYPSDSQCPACHQPADRWGHHSFVCGTGGETISRHNALREGLIRLAQSAGLNPRREAPFLLPGLNRRPADLLIPFAGNNGQDLCLDVTVTAALKNDVIDRGAEEPGHAANEAHRRKENQVGDAVRAAGMTFRPMAVENLGGWTESAIHEIKKLATDKAIRHGYEVKKTISAEFKSLSCLLMRGNAEILLNRCLVVAPPPQSQPFFPDQ